MRTKATDAVTSATLADSHDVDTLISLADMHFGAGQMQDAMLAYQRVLELQPRHVDVLHRMALACFQENQIDGARRYLDLALTAAPERSEIWENRGLLAAFSGDCVVAEALYHRALSLAGSTPSLHRNLADSLRIMGRMTEARTHYGIALELDPSLHYAARRLASISLDHGQVLEAANFLLRAWEVDQFRPPDGEALIKVLSRLQNDSKMDPLIAKIRACFATNAYALKELAFALNSVHRFEAALSVATQGLDLEPQNAWLHHNASYSFNMLGNYPLMRLHSGEAARLQPDNAHMQFNLAAAMLRLGEFEQGWKQYRWHDALPYNDTLARPHFPEWMGQSVAGCRFLLLGEQGLGDQLQFLCLAAWLHRQGATVDVWVSPALADVARCANGVHQVWTTLPPKQYDYWCRMFRMPEHMRLDPTMLPIAMPYVSPEPDDVRQWRERLADGNSSIANKTLRVGLVWAGNPAYELDRYRSIPLQTLMPMLSCTGVAWFSLQVDGAQSELDGLPDGIDMTVLGPKISRFSDTLAILQTLDLLITVDTSVAHLAGASGRPVWILLPTCSDWRWMAERSDSPWYPSARLFRQKEAGRWDSVVTDVTTALQQVASEQHAQSSK